MTGSLPQDAAARKAAPMAEGLLWYFPNALAAVAAVSKAGNDQHNPGEPLHHARGKSMDHADCIIRHLVDAGTIDTDGQRHTAKMAWRALALLQEEIEREEGVSLPRNARLDQSSRLIGKVESANQAAVLVELVREAERLDLYGEANKAAQTVTPNEPDYSDNAYLARFGPNTLAPEASRHPMAAEADRIAGSAPDAETAYAKGWRRAAMWALRDDLIADIGSPAFERDLAKDLSYPSPEDRL